MDEGLTLLLTNRVEDARVFFERRREAGDVRLALGAIYAAFFAASSNPSDEALELLIEQCWEVNGRAMRLGEVPLAALVQADCHALASVAQFMTQHQIKGAWNLRKAWKLYLEAQKRLQGYEEDDRVALAAWAEFGVGLFQLLVSLLPGTILKFVELLGFEGDRRAALALLTRSFDANHFTSPFSCLMLLMHHVVIALFTGEQNEESLANAQRLLDWARQRYPSGVAFLYFQARFHRCRGELDLATRVSDRALQECRDMKLGRGWLFTFLFQRGWCSYLLTRWDETTEFFAPLLQSPVFHSEKSRPSMRAFHAYHIGLCHVMLGQRDRARQSFETVALHVSDIKNPRRIESFALRKARHFLAADGHVCPPLEVAELCIMWEGFAQMDARTRALHAALLDKACAFYGVRVEGEPLRFDGDNEQAARAGEPAEHPVWATWTSAGSFKPFHALRLYLTRAFLAYANGQEALAVWCLEHVLRSVEAADKVTVKHAHEDGVVPLAAFLRGQIYYSNGDFAHAKEMHRKASSFSDFDLYQNIQFRLHAFGQLIDAALAKRS